MDFAALQHSVFLQALGSAILNSLWQGFIIWIIYETINTFYKTATSSFKNKLSTLLIFVAFAWFLSSFISGIFNDEKLSSIASSSATAIMAKSSTDSEFSIHSILSYAAGSLPYLSVSYIFLLFFLMAKLFSAYRYVYFIANKRLIAPPLQLQDFATKVAAQMNIAKKISVWISHNIDVPATIGFLKPVILIPVASINSLSSHQLEAIILHELSHIKRNDYITNLVISVIETILFFNPFILLLSKVIRRERENCCDDFVIQYRYDPHSYASALLRLEQSRRSNLQLAIGAVSGKKQLLTRIKRITNKQSVSKQFNYGQKLLALLLVTGIICSVAWLSPQATKKNNNKIIAKNVKPVERLQVQNQQAQDPEISDAENLPVDTKPLKENQQNDSKLSMPKSNVTHTTSVDNQVNKEKNDIELNDLTEENPEFFAAINSKNSKLFFDQKTLKFAPFKSLPNFPFQNLNIHINIAELNEDLKNAYKEINAMDWKKIQNDINESLLKINVNQLSEIEMAEFYKENANNLYEIKSAIAKKYAKTLSNQIKAKALLKDSLRMRVALANELYSKIENWSKVKSPTIYEQSGSNFYNDVYEPVSNHQPVLNDLPQKKFRKNISISKLNNKNVKIIVDQLTQVFEEGKKSFHYSFEKDAHKDAKQKLIRIEVNDDP